MDIDLVFANGFLIVLFNDGNGAFDSAVSYSDAYGMSCADTIDFNHDNHIDIVYTSGAGNTFSILQNDGSGQFNSVYYQVLCGIPDYVSVADFNNDNNSDLVMGFIQGCGMQVYLYEDGFFQPYALNPESEDCVPRPGDFNNDGNVDFVTVNGAVYLNFGDGNFQLDSIYLADFYAKFYVQPVDLNNDGILDLAATWSPQYPSERIYLLDGNGDGTFTQRTFFYLVGDRAGRIVHADYNNDGYADLTCVNQFSDSYSLLINKGNGMFFEPVEYSTDLFPEALASSDFDGDGDFDIAVGCYNDGNDEISIFYNLGCFTCGDANGDGKVDLLDATFIINYLYKGGPAPDPMESADADCSGSINILDSTYLINYLYKGGPEPCADCD